MTSRLIICGWLAVCTAGVWMVPPLAQAQLQSPFVPEAVDPAPPPGDVGAAEATDSGDGILGLNLEQLGRVDVVVPAMDVEVTSVTRTESTVGRSAAAIFVITPEMIRRSGATSIPETLRMVPGLNVAKINSNAWAVSSRGFNSRYANKLLVQIDGRSVYTPTFSGTYWEAIDVMLEDVERIEVIRGPGATVWGANAVNGVINVITKKAADTQGVLITGGAGNEERGFTAARYGGKLGDDLHWRVYGKQFDRDTGTIPGDVAHDDWRMVQTGFRTEWTPNSCDTLTVQADYFDNHAGLTATQHIGVFPFMQTITENAHFSGSNVLGRWSRDLGEDHGWALQFFYDRFTRHTSVLDECRSKIDVDFQHQYPLTAGHQLIWGGGYRFNEDHLEGTYQISFTPHERDTNLFSYFLQDEITLCEDRLFLTVGSKFEHNDYSNFEYQPSARLLFSPDPRRAAWAAVSRAVRTPSRSDDDMRNIIFAIPMGAPPTPPLMTQLTGNPAVQAEDLLAYEIGYRAQPTDAFSWDLAVFFNVYEDLIVFAPGGFPGGVPPIWLWNARNAMDGETYGFELTATYQLTDCWRITGWYSYLQMQLHANAGIIPRVETPESGSPHSQAYVRSSWELADDVQFDLMLRYIDPVRGSTGRVPGYISMDARLGWRPSRHFEAAIVGQNLLDNHHSEFYGTDAIATEVDRGVYGVVTWQF